MKKHLFTIAAICFAIMAHAAVIVDETFNYSAANLADVSDWTTSGTLTTGDGRLIQATPLSYSNAGGEYVLSGEGKSLKNNYAAGSNYIAYKQFAKVNSGAVYVSYLYQADGDQGQSQSEIFGLANATGNSTLKAWAGKQSGGTKNPFRLGVTRISTTGADIQWADDKLVDKNDVVLIVLKYDFSTEAASLFINPVIGTTAEPTADKVDSEKGTPKNSLEYLMFKHNGSSVAKFVIGGVRVSTTWAEAVAKKVTGLPALDAPVVGAASNIGAEQFTANWSTVANASGYKVSVYAGSDEIAVKTVNDPAAVNLVFYNMPVATELTYKVIALGDGANYDNSEASAASAAFSTAAAPTALIFLPSADEWAPYAEDKGAHTLGSFPSAYALGYDFSSAYIELSKDEEGKSFSGTLETTGERFTARVQLDKNTAGGMLTLPAVASAARVDLYLAAGTEGKKIKVQQYNYANGAWVDLSELTLTKALAMYSLTPNAGVVKLRIANADGSGKQIWKVVTFAAAPTTLDAPVVADATDLTSASFTANWAAVANASGYRVLITSADTTIRATVAQDVQTLAVDQLKPETEYTVKVAAIGDNVAYVGSVLSDGKVITTNPTSGTDINPITGNPSPITHKIIIDGQLFILRDGELFTITGAKMQ